MRHTDQYRSPPSTGMRAVVGRNRVVSFFVVMFAWSWGYWALVGAFVRPELITPFVTLPGLWGPLVAGLVVVWASDTRVHQFLGRILRWQVEARWYAVAVCGVAALGAVGPSVQALLVGDGLELQGPVALLLTFAIAILAGGSEEVGLRGFAHPRLRERYSALVAGVVIGVLWAVWHLPLQRLGVGFDGSFFLFVGALVPISVLFGWLYDSTGGSVLPVVVAHATFDAPSVVSPTGPVPDDVIFYSRLVVVGVYLLLVVGLVVKNGTRLSGTSSLPSPAAAATSDGSPADGQ